MKNYSEAYEAGFKAGKEEVTAAWVNQVNKAAASWRPGTLEYAILISLKMEVLTQTNQVPIKTQESE